MLRERVLLQLLQDDFDGLLKLRVVALAEGSGSRSTSIVRGNAVVLDLPIAVEAIDGGTWGGHTAAVE